MPPFLTTARLQLRRLAQADLEWLSALHADPAVMRYIGPVKSAEETAQRMETLLAQARPGLGVFPASLRETGEVIGWFVLTQLEQTGEVEVGYRLFQAHWGQGYATEGTGALLRHGFETLGLPRIVAVTHLENAASQRVLQKAGLQREADQFHYGMPVAFFSLEKTAWAAWS